MTKTCFRALIFFNFGVDPQIPRLGLALMAHASISYALRSVNTALESPRQKFYIHACPLEKFAFPSS